MSYIGHLCTQCGHPDIWRLAQSGQGTRCDSDGCGCRCTNGQPAVRPTFDLAGRRVERIVEPGQPITRGMPTCGCQDCNDLYAKETQAA